MTYREKLMQEHPEFVNERYWGGCRNCPSYYGYTSPGDCPYPHEMTGDDYPSDAECRACWDRGDPKGGHLTMDAYPVKIYAPSGRLLCQTLDVKFPDYESALARSGGTPCAALLSDRGGLHRHPVQARKKGRCGVSAWDYTVYDRKTGLPVAFGSAKVCARQLGILVATFYTIIDRAKRGKYSRKWEIVREVALDDDQR